MTVQCNKKTFTSHIKYCTGINSIKYNFNNDKIICFNTIQKSLPQPFTIYYDLETTAGQDNEGMRTISYVYSLSFNEEIRNKFEELKNIYEYRCLNKEAGELSTYHLPECIMRYVDKSDLTDIEKQVHFGYQTLNSKIPMERHSLEIIYWPNLTWTRMYYLSWLASLDLSGLYPVKLFPGIYSLSGSK